MQTQYRVNTDQSVHYVFASVRVYRCVFVSVELDLICIWILTVRISIQTQYRVNTDESIHNVFASIRVYGCVFVSIERDLICIWILTVCISIQSQYRPIRSRYFASIRVPRCMDVYSPALNGT